MNSVCSLFGTYFVVDMFYCSTLCVMLTYHVNALYRQCIPFEDVTLTTLVHCDMTLITQHI